MPMRHHVVVAAMAARAAALATTVWMVPVVPIKYMRSKLLMFAGIAIVAGMVGIGLFFYTSRDPKYPFAEKSLGADFESLALEASQAASRSDDPNKVIGAKATEAYGRFMSLDPEQKLEAVRVVGQLYKDNPNSPEVQARAINMLTQMVVTSDSEEIFNAVYGSEPFAQYRKEGDYLGSIAALSQASYDIYPTGLGIVFTLIDEAGKLVNKDKKYALTEAEKQTYAKTIADSMQTLQQAHETDLRSVADSPRAALTKFVHYFWSAYLYAAAARGNKQYEQNAKQFFEQLFAFYDSEKGQNGKPIPALEIRVPAHHMTYALFLIRMGGEENIAKAKEHIAKAISIIEANPAYHEHGYIQKLRNAANESFVAVNEEVETRSMQRAADVYPPFKEFAKKYGLVLK
jgi:hypothetical protein